MESERATRYIALALNLYCDDFDGRYPSAHNWTEAAGLYRVHFSLPEEPQGAPGFAFLRKLQRMNPDAIREPAKQVLVFETSDRRANAAYNFVNVGWRNERPIAVGMVDGSVRMLRRTDLNIPRAGTGRIP